MSWGSNEQQAHRLAVPDHGIWYDEDVFNLVRGSTGLILTGATTPLLDLTSDYLMIKWAASSSVAAYIKWRLPREAAYLPSKKSATSNIPFLRFRLNLALRSGGATDAPQVTVTAKLRSATGAVKGVFTPTSIDADGSLLTTGKCKALTTGGSTNPELRTWDFFETYASGPLYAEPGDSVDIKIVPDAHTTDTLELHQAYIQACKNLGYTNIALRV